MSTFRVNVMAAFRSIAVLLVLLLPTHPVWAKTYAVVVEGLGGNAQYQASFSASVTAFTDALSTLDSVDGNSDDRNSSNGTIIRLDASATRVDILDAIETQSSLMMDDSGDGAAVFALVLIGHGTADNRNWRFNITGPDLSTDDLVAALNSIPTQQQLVVLGASASGAALDTLSQLGRVLVTATKSGGEINAVRFPGFLADAVASGAADYDRNEILTIAEAYRFAQARTAEYYEQEKLLASEHSRLRGENAPDMAIAYLGSLKDAKDNPVVASLLEQRLQLENAFKAIKQRKPEMAVNAYYEELEQMLLSIARLQQDIDKASGWSDSDSPIPRVGGQ